MKKCTSFEEKNSTIYIRGNVYFDIIVFSCLSSTKAWLRFLLICFAREVKDFYQSSLGNEIDFRDIMNVSPNVLKVRISKNWNMVFIYERVLIITTFILWCHWKTFVLFLPAKEQTWKRIFNTNNELSQNCTENQIMPSKTINWLFNDIWSHLFVGCFDWKIVVFQQTVVRFIIFLKYLIYKVRVSQI